MHISMESISQPARTLLEYNNNAISALAEIEDSIASMITDGFDRFIINDTLKLGNGVVPIKEKFYQTLEYDYHWYREKPLTVLTVKGGPIDVYKEFNDGTNFKVGLEFETGNISSAHRSLNKLLLGLHASELDLGVIILPIFNLSKYLTDRVSNFEELVPYFHLVEQVPFVIFGFDAEEYSDRVPFLPKGKDGQSKRSVRKWKNR